MFAGTTYLLRNRNLNADSFQIEGDTEEDCNK